MDLWNKDNNELDCRRCSSDWIPIHLGSIGWIVHQYSVRRSQNYCVCSTDRRSLEYRQWSLSVLHPFRLCQAVSFRLLAFVRSGHPPLVWHDLCTDRQGIDCWLKLICRDQIRLNDDGKGREEGRKIQNEIPKIKAKIFSPTMTVNIYINLICMYISWCLFYQKRRGLFLGANFQKICFATTDADHNNICFTSFID